VRGRQQQRSRLLRERLGRHRKVQRRQVPWQRAQRLLPLLRPRAQASRPVPVPVPALPVSK
jgi:hypothetical protein